MENQMLHILRKSGVIKGNTPNIINIQKMSVKKIFNIIEESVEATTSIKIKPNISKFTHSASLSLSGTRKPCQHLKCRINKISQVARFAALYSDQVYIHNFLSNYLMHPLPIENINEEELKNNFIEDIIVYSKISPLIESNIIIPYVAPKNICPNCLAEKSFGTNAGKRFKKKYKELCDEYFNNTEIYFEKKSVYYALKCKSTEELLEHGIQILTRESPCSILKSMPRLLSKVENGESVLLSNTIKKKLKIHKNFAEDIIQNISFELASAQCLNTNFLTERPIHIDVLNSISKDKHIGLNNHIAYKYITSNVPFLGEINISDVLKVRKRENEAFLVYRNALAQAINEYKSKKTILTKSVAQEIYFDIIAPKLAILDRRVEIAKKDLIKSGSRKLIGWVGAISFGVYLGYLNSDLIKMATALGLTKVIADFTEMLMNKSDSEQEIQNNDMYFLWKVQQLRK